MTEKYSIGSFVYFDENEIQVYVGSNAKDDYIFYGELLLIFDYITRLTATIKRDKNAKDILLSLASDPRKLNSAIDHIIDDYSKNYGINNLLIVKGLNKDSDNRGCDYFISFQTGSHSYIPKFTPHGFGMLGKDVEISSVISCLLTIKYIIDSYGEDKNFKTIIINSALR